MQNVLKALDEVLGEKNRLIEELLAEIDGLRDRQQWEIEKMQAHIAELENERTGSKAELESQQARSAQFHGIVGDTLREWIVDALAKADLEC